MKSFWLSVAPVNSIIGGHGGGASRFGNDHPTYLRLGHYSAGQAKRASQGFIQF